MKGPFLISLTLVALCFPACRSRSTASQPNPGVGKDSYSGAGDGSGQGSTSQGGPVRKPEPKTRER